MDVGARCADLVLNSGILLVVVVDVKTKASRVDATVTPDEESTEDGLSEQVKDTVEDGLRVRGNDVATLTKTPGKRVQDPEESGERTANGEGLANIAAKSVGVTASLPDKNPDNVEEGSAAEGKVAPLVRAADESTNETSDNHNLIDQDDEEKSGPRHGGGQQEIHQEERSGDEPVDVADVEDLTVDTADNGVVAHELNIDRGPTKVGGHGEVGDSGDHGNGSGDVVEDTVLARLGDTQTKEDEGASSHDSADSPVPVRTADGDGNVDGLAVDSVACRFGKRAVHSDGKRQQTYH